MYPYLLKQQSEERARRSVLSFWQRLLALLMGEACPELRVSSQWLTDAKRGH